MPSPFASTGRVATTQNSYPLRHDAQLVTASLKKVDRMGGYGVLRMISLHESKQDIRVGEDQHF
jgi:hypothetical protein